MIIWETNQPQTVGKYVVVSKSTYENVECLRTDIEIWDGSCFYNMDSRNIPIKWSYINMDDRNMFIQAKQYKIGDIVKTTIEHDSFAGKFEIGSEVIVNGIGDRGYNIKDICGHCINEIGWII